MGADFSDDFNFTSRSSGTLTYSEKPFSDSIANIHNVQKAFRRGLSSKAFQQYILVTNTRLGRRQERSDIVP